ncbi:hypothetical protein ANN_08432 [Periplaneta americana]|uniref:Uncharacterized protein n=1 Tax=Periplaneta americana TaxID=6978 RepID=A0ABQ8T1F2_PERAM|nr:hypothetical protein ANN_08432 [Periplaneta americana]
MESDDFVVYDIKRNFATTTLLNRKAAASPEEDKRHSPSSQGWVVARSLLAELIDRAVPNPESMLIQSTCNRSSSRHHKIRSVITTCLKSNGYTTYEGVHGIADTGSHRRIDITFKPGEIKGYILDPTIRFETHQNQPEEVNLEKRTCTKSGLSVLQIISERKHYFNTMDEKDLQMRFSLSKTLALDILNSIEGDLEFPIDSSEAWTMRKYDERMITTYEMCFMRRIVGFTSSDRRRNEDMSLLENLKETSVLNNIQEYQENWQDHINMDP